MKDKLWFNSTSSDYKTILKAAGAWASGGTLNLGRSGGGASGIQTAAVFFGGAGPVPGGADANSEEYNGSTWAEGNDLNTARQYLAGAGTQTAAIGISGGGAVNNETYNGTSWTEIANVNTARDGGGGAGSTTAALLAGGTPNSAVVEQWDGSSWTEVGDLNTGRAYVSSTKNTPSTATSVFAGGAAPVATRGKVHESWNGTSWTELADLNTARQAASGGCGASQDYALCVAGHSATATTGVTELWDGSSWTEVADLSTARDNSFGCGTGSLALVGGGEPPDDALASTEEWNFESTLGAGAWASGGNLNTAVYVTQGFGTQTAAAKVGGYGADPGRKTNVEEYNGSAW